MIVWWRRHDEYDAPARTASAACSVPKARRRHAFLGVSTLLFAASMAATIAWCLSMSGMGEIPMPASCTRR